MHASVARELGLGDGRGIGVLQVMPDSPASRAGLRAGDLLVSPGGEPLRSVGDVQRDLSRVSVDATVEAVVVRANARISLSIALAPARDD